MWDEAELQQIGRASTEDVLAELDTVSAPAEQFQAPPSRLPRPSPSSAAKARLPFKAAIDAWFKRQAAYDAKPDTFEKLLDQQKRERNRRDWRAEYQLRVHRPVRGYERDQTPERRKEKKAAKSKEERLRRLAASTPEQIEAERQAARIRAKASREAAKQRRAEAEQEAQATLHDDPNFARF